MSTVSREVARNSGPNGYRALELTALRGSGRAVRDRQARDDASPAPGRGEQSAVVLVAAKDQQTPRIGFPCRYQDAGVAGDNLHELIRSGESHFAKRTDGAVAHPPCPAPPAPARQVPKARAGVGPRQWCRSATAAERINDRIEPKHTGKVTCWSAGAVAPTWLPAIERYDR